MSRRSDRTCLALLVSLVMGCGSPSPEPTPPPSANDPGAAAQIRGNERIAWAQRAASLQEARAHTFVMYVDGVPNNVSDVQCASGDSSGFACSARLPTMSPGRHVLEMSARWNGMESPRSAPLVVQLVALLAATPAESDHGTSSARSPISCASDDCYDVHPIADGRLTLPVAIPHDRLLFVEGGRVVRVVDGGALLSEPALSLDDPGARIVGLAADARFEQTHAVYLSWTSERRDGLRELHVTRYRDLRNVLGEPATIVSGIAVPDESLAPLALGGDGLLYLAVPGFTGNGALDAYGGFLLRFTADGRVPPMNRNASPVVAVGFERPTALAVGANASHLWLAGRRDGWPFSVATVPVLLPEDAPWPYRPDAHPAFHDEIRGAQFLTLLRWPGDTRLLLHVVAAPDIYSVDADVHTTRFTDIPQPLALAELNEREMYVVAAGAADRSVLLRLTLR